MTTAGEPVWLELNTSDMARAKSFYGSLFGWTFSDSGEDFGHYHMVYLGDDLVAGAMQIDPETMQGARDQLAVYLATDDAEATASRVAECGGMVVVPPMKVGESGSMAFFIDPTRAGVGAWQGADLQGIGVMMKPGAPCWFELMTNDYGKAIAFYRDAFGWDVHPMGPQGGQWQYSTLGEGFNAKAGLCDASTFIPPEGISYWRSYIGVENCDASVAKLTELGGRLLDGPIDTQFGRVATVADDQGTLFQLLQAAPPATS